MSGRESSRHTLRELYRTLHALSAAVRHLLERCPVESLPDAPVTVEQMRVLRFLTLNPDIRVGEVANGLGIKPSSTSLALDRLELKGLVARETGSGDRRTVRLAVTPDGRTLVRKVERAIDAKMEAMVTHLGVKTTERLSQVARELVAALMVDEEYFPEICRHCGPGYQHTCAVHKLFGNCPYGDPDSDLSSRFSEGDSTGGGSSRPD
jgi:DNA-binding MarR family transcriptional regulator